MTTPKTARKCWVRQSQNQWSLVHSLKVAAQPSANPGFPVNAVAPSSPIGTAEATAHRALLPGVHGGPVVRAAGARAGRFCPARRLGGNGHLQGDCVGDEAGPVRAAQGAGPLELGSVLMRQAQSCDPTKIFCNGALNLALERGSVQCGRCGQFLTKKIPVSY